MKFFLQIFELILLIQWIHGANILFYIGALSSHSHQYGLEPLANKLADRGHKVTFFSPIQRIVNHSEVNHFCPSELSKFHKDFSTEYGVQGLKSRLEERFSINLFKGSNFFDPCLRQNEVAVKSSEFKKWSENNKFDLIIIDSTCNEVAFGLAHKYGAKTILYTPIGSLYMWDFDLFGIPPESSWFPTWDNNYEGEMGLIARIFNAYSTLKWYNSYRWDYLIKVDKLIGKELKMKETDTDRALPIPSLLSSSPSLIDLVRKTELILSSQHYSDQFSKSLPPFVVPVGGMHLKESSGKLDKELEAFIEEGDEGFMYISFGSIVRISTIPPELLEVFFESLQVFHNLRFLWKWEGPAPKNIPENVLFRPWFSQKDVLAHPQIRGFISQGGQVSIQEAIFNGVPLIVIPVNGDQDMNAKRIRSVGNGIEMEFFDLTAPHLILGITSLLTNPKYAEKSRLLSKLSRDRPMSALDTAVWWTEYILRHDDNSYLKTLGFDQPWWKTRLVDVWVTLFLALLSIGLPLIYLIKLCLRIPRFVCMPEPAPKLKMI